MVHGTPKGSSNTNNIPPAIADVGEVWEGPGDEPEKNLRYEYKNAHWSGLLIPDVDVPPAIAEVGEVGECPDLILYTWRLHERLGDGPEKNPRY